MRSCVSKRPKGGVVGGGGWVRFGVQAIRKALGGLCDVFDQRIMGSGVENGELEQVEMNEW